MNTHPHPLPIYPHLARLSDPCRAFGQQAQKLQELAIRNPRKLSADELCFIFNAWWPGGTFEELAAYLPHALNLLQAEQQDAASAELVYLLLVWCHLEAEQLRRYTALHQSLQDAFMQLFERWSSSLAWQRDADDGRLIATYADHLDNLLGRLRREAQPSGHTLSCLPWLQAQHYLPRLHAADSAQRAVWALWASNNEQDILPPVLRLTGEQRRAAQDIATHWLHSEASEEEAAIWGDIITPHKG